MGVVRTCLRNTGSFSTNIIMMPMPLFIWLLMSLSSAAMAHEVDQHFGAYSDHSGESRVMAKFMGRADSQPFANGVGVLSLSITAQSEDVKSKDKYTQDNFSDGRRVDRTLGVDGSLTLFKRSELTLGGSQAGDSVTKTASVRAAVGQWFFSDQLRFGLNVSESKTRRPTDSFLDYDSLTIVTPSKVNTTTGGVSLKAILNPRTTVTADYSVVKSTDRPLLRSWSLGARQFFDDCECAIHGETARVINLGRLDSSMATGELTGLQVTMAYLQTLWQKAHGRLAYRYAREDEFTRAYGDHLVFGADSYVAGLSQELEGIMIGEAERPLLVDIAATRYIHNKSGSATTFELGGSVKF